MFDKLKQIWGEAQSKALAWSSGKSKGESLPGILMVIIGIVFLIVVITSILPDYIELLYNLTWDAAVPTYFTAIWGLLGLFLLIGIIGLFVGMARRR